MCKSQFDQKSHSLDYKSLEDAAEMLNCGFEVVVYYFNVVKATMRVEEL